MMYIMMYISVLMVKIIIGLIGLMLALRFWAWAIAHFRIWYNSDYARLVEKKAKKTHRKEDKK